MDPCGLRVSRVKQVVLQSAGVAPLSKQMLHQHLLLLGKIVRAPDSSLLRRCVFIEGSLQPQVGQFVRRVGRPRQDWATHVLNPGLEKCGRKKFEALLNTRGADSELVWKRELQTCFKYHGVEGLL